MAVPFATCTDARNLVDAVERAFHAVKRTTGASHGSVSHEAGGHSWMTLRWDVRFYSVGIPGWGSWHAAAEVRVSLDPTKAVIHAFGPDGNNLAEPVTIPTEAFLALA